MNQNFHVKVEFKTNGETCLHLCAEFNQVELFKWFVEDFGADIACLNDAKETPFIIAAREGKTDIIRLYFDEYKQHNRFDINHKMVDGWCALHYATMNGFANIVELLVKEGEAEINILDRFQRNALHWACRFNSQRLIDKLLQLGIRYEMKDVEQQTPLDLCRLYNHHDAEYNLGEFIKEKKAEADRKQKLKKKKAENSKKN